MERWQIRKEVDKLNDVERSLYNTMYRHPKHINCPNIVLKRSKPKRAPDGYFGYPSQYGLYCKNHSVFLDWISYELADDDLISKWSKLGIKRID